MSLYKFLNQEEKMLKIELKSHTEAIQYAKENNLLCLTMDYHNFIEVFNGKINKFKNHIKYEWLKEQAEKAISLNCGYGHESAKANDFMHRIITLPTNYIRDWLDGKNQLEWKQEYM